MPNNSSTTRYQLEDFPNGKATEALLMRFNPREFELLNRAFNHVSGARSRHAWIHDVLMREARTLMEQGEGIKIDSETNLPYSK